MSKFFILVAALCCGAALAECPNGCNQHGKCNLYSACECYRNWMGADCSERVCYFGHAFIDTAQGDINSDGVVSSSQTYTTQYTNAPAWELYDLTSHGKGAEAAGSWGYRNGLSSHTAFAPILEVYETAAGAAPAIGGSDLGTPKNWDEAHFYRECSNKGTCNRQTGQCACFKGYEGEGCTRTVCPNECSGHGVCERLKDSNSLYEAWDAYKTQQCVCDAGFMGPDCSLRKCAQGDDPVSRVQSTEVQVFGFTPFGEGGFNLGTSRFGLPEDFHGRFALKFTDEHGDSWTTKALYWPSGPFATDTATGAPNSAKGTCNGTVALCNNCGTTNAIATANQRLAFAAKTKKQTMEIANDKGHCQISTTEEIENALKALPNNVIPDVSVSFHFANSNADQRIAATGVPSAATASTNSGWAYKITFTGNSGNVQPLEVLYEVTQCTGAGSCDPNHGTAITYSSQNTAESPALQTQNGVRLPHASALGANTGKPKHTEIYWNNDDTGSGTANDATDDTGHYANPIASGQYAAHSTTDHTSTYLRVASGTFVAGAKAKFHPNLGVDAGTPVLNPVQGFTGWPFASTGADVINFASNNKLSGTEGTTENAVCSNRGLCDYTTGLCKCFAGYTKGDCSSQNSLAMN